MKKKIIIIISALCLLGAILYGSAYLIYQSRIKNIELAHPDLATISDGQYTGKFNAIFVQAAVTLEVQDHKITTIKLDKHVYDRGEKGADIVEKALKAQSTDIDTISGATNSSNVILKSIENALDKGVK